MGNIIATELVKDDSTLNFKLGYHAIPSMRQLHMHVISQDFDSERLTNKKHWNSFTTEFFIDAEDVIDMLNEKGEVKFDPQTYEKYLEKNLTCHRCSREIANLPKLLVHIKKCKGPASDTW